jgi:hypothetical protein
MKLKWVLLVMGLAAGIALIGLGTLIISENFRAGLAIGIEDGEYHLLQPDKDVMRAGVLITASGIVAVSVSLTSMIVLWKRNTEHDAAQIPKEEMKGV